MSELPERVPVRFGVWTLVRERRRIWARAHQTGLLVDGLGLGSLRLQRPEGAKILLLDGSELPWTRPAGISSPNLVGQPLTGNGELGTWRWTVQGERLLFQSLESERRVWLEKDRDELVVEDRERRAHYQGTGPHLESPEALEPEEPAEASLTRQSPSAQLEAPAFPELEAAVAPEKAMDSPSIAAPGAPTRAEDPPGDRSADLEAEDSTRLLLEDSPSTAAPDEPETAPSQADTVTLTCRRGKLCFSTPLELTDPERSLLELVLDMGRLTDADLLNRKGRRANNQLEDLKVRLAQHGLPLVQKTEGGYQLDLGLDQVRWTDA